MSATKLIAYVRELGLISGGRRMICYYGSLQDIFISLVSGDGQSFTLTLRLESAREGEEAALRAQTAKEILGEDAQIIKSDGTLLSQMRLKKNDAARMRDIVENALPRLREAGFGGKLLCAACGGEIMPGDEAYYRKNAVVSPLHNACCDERLRQDDLAAREARDQAHGLRGALGALLGAAIGAALYFVVGLLGYVASFVGLATGYLCDYFYRKFGGAPGRKKLVVLVLALLFSVALGQSANHLYAFNEYYPESGFAESGVSRAQYAVNMLICWASGDAERFLGWNYDIVYASLPEAERAYAMPRAEFIKENLTYDLAEGYREGQRDFLSALGQGLLYTALGGALFVVRASKDDQKGARLPSA